MNRTHKRRLLKVVDYLMGMRKKWFDIGIYCNILMYPTKNINYEDFHDKSKLKEHMENHTCGSVGCVVGHFPIWFPRDFQYKDRWTVENKKNDLTSYSDIATDYFGLSYCEVKFLFSDAGYKANPLPQTVAKRILGFINKDNKTMKEYKLFDESGLLCQY